jgi:predicted RNase H-like nuclease (RuvC/YqgF family)
MAEEPKEKWLNYLALTTVILAVCATLSTFKGAGYSTRSVLSQTQASDQWAYYQAKSIKGYLYEIQKEALELEFKKDKIKGSMSLARDYEKKIEIYSQKLKRYEGEKAEIKKEAEKLESLRDDAQKHAGIFGLAVIFLQIAILLSSIAALMKKKVIWVIGVGTGAIGLVYFANGFLLFF